jgi:hypothetical protein
MSIDYYAGCTRCKCFRSFGTLRAHSFVFEQAPNNDPRAGVLDFMVDHSSCPGLVVGLLDEVPDSWQDGDPDSQKERGD